MSIYDPISIALGIEPIELDITSYPITNHKKITGPNKPGYKLSEETKAKMRKPKDKPSHRKGKSLPESHKTNLRKPNSDEHNSNISLAVKQRIKDGNFKSPTFGGHKELTKLKISQSHKNLKTCPHCGKSSTGISMYRWHFNNCAIVQSD